MNNRQLLSGLLMTAGLVTANISTAAKLSAACNKDCGFTQEDARGTRSDSECSNCHWVLCHWTTQACVNLYGDNDNAFCNDLCSGYEPCIQQ